MRATLVARLLWIDSLGGLAVGAFVLLAYDVLAAWYRLPVPVVVGMGLANVAYGTTSFALALTPRWRRVPAIAGLSLANVAWGGVCAWLLLRHGAEASTLGRLTLLAEGLYVPLLGCAEWWFRHEIARPDDLRGPQWSLVECRVPPPVVALLTAAAMHALARTWPDGVPISWRSAGGGLAVAGVSLAVWAIASFRRAATTIHPMAPHEASTLVIAGPNRWSRNPMYVGLLAVLVGWGVWLGSAAALLAVPVAWAWLTRFQVVPEERALAARFGAAYAAYRATVRRWV